MEDSKTAALAIQPQSFQLTAADGFVLGATRFDPPQPAGRTMVLGSAMGVKQSFYYPLASWYAQQGWHGYTLDYRGIGRSMPPEGHLKRSGAIDVTTWATQDLSALLRQALAAHPENSLYYTGNSLSGQLLGQIPEAVHVRKAVFVSAQSGWWGWWPGLGKAKMLFNWYVMFPVLTGVFGYFPGKKLGAMENLPAGVSHQWARWCRHRRYLFGYLPAGAGLYHSLTMPILAWGFSDDPFAPQESIEWLANQYTAAPKTVRYHQPKYFGRKSIGHFGYYKAASQADLWPQTLDWLLAE